MQADKDADKPDELVSRREDRNSTNWIATIRLADGSEIPCTVKDVSKSGAKIGVPGRQPLPDTFLLRVIGKDFLCRVRLAWRRGDYAGVRIERVGKVPVAPPPPREPVPPPEAPQPPATVAPEAVATGGVGIRSRKRGFSAF